MSLGAEILPVDASSHIKSSPKKLGRLLTFTYVHQNYSRVVVVAVAAVVVAVVLLVK